MHSHTSSHYSTLKNHFCGTFYPKMLSPRLSRVQVYNYAVCGGYNSAMIDAQHAVSLTAVHRIARAHTLTHTHLDTDEETPQLNIHGNREPGEPQPPPAILEISRKSARSHTHTTAGS